MADAQEKKIYPANDAERRTAYEARKADLAASATDEAFTDRFNGKQFDRLIKRLKRASKKTPGLVVTAGYVSRRDGGKGPVVILDASVADIEARMEGLIVKANARYAGCRFDLANDLMVIEAARQLGGSVTDRESLHEHIVKISPSVDSMDTARSQVRAVLKVSGPKDFQKK